jgi:hypothetical protein
LPFVPVCLSSVSDPCPYPSCLCLPLDVSFFLVSFALKVDGFTSPSPFSEKMGSGLGFWYFGICSPPDQST